jgi:hypothetical protein
MMLDLRTGKGELERVLDLYTMRSVLFISGELAIASSGRALDLLLPRNISRADEKIGGNNVSRVTPFETLANRKKSAPPIRSKCEPIPDLRASQITNPPARRIDCIAICIELILDSVTEGRRH